MFDPLSREILFYKYKKVLLIAVLDKICILFHFQFNGSKGRIKERKKLVPHH